MKYENSLTVFTFLLIASLYLYFVTSISSFRVINVCGEIISIVAFSITLLGLFISSFKIKKSLSCFYYFGLFLLSLLVLVSYILPVVINNLMYYYFILAILIALLLSLLDFRYLILVKSRMVEQYRIRMFKLQNELQGQKKAIERYKSEAEKKAAEVKEAKGQVTEIKSKSYSISKKASELQQNTYNLQKQLNGQKKSTERYKSEAEKKAAEVKEAKGQVTEIKSKSYSVNKELKQREKHILALKKRSDELKKRNENLAKGKKSIAQFKLSQEKLKRDLTKTQKEVNRQAELKAQYSKTLRSIRKRKKEEEELLIVSSDGKSVHRPKCIAVRNIPKENRKLIKNWEDAQKEGYKGCGLCKPHIKPQVIINDNVEYKFVASKISDKVHKASCMQVKNINRKDRDYFKTYKAALKKGYTSCRICNSGEN